MAESNDTADLGFFWQQFVNSVVEIPTDIGEALDDLSQASATGIQGNALEWIDQFDVPDAVKTRIKQVISSNSVDTPVFDIIFSIIQYFQVVSQTMTSPTAVLGEIQQQTIMREAPFRPADLQSIVVSQMLNGGDLKVVPDAAKKHGITDTAWQQMIDGLTQLPSPDQVVNAWLIGSITNENIESELKRVGVLDEKHRQVMQDTAFSFTSVPEASLLFFRQKIDKEQRDRLYQFQGVPKGEEKLRLETQRPIPQFGDLIELHRRGKFKDRGDTTQEGERKQFNPESGDGLHDTFDGGLSQLGYDETSRDKIDSLWERIPDVRDLWDQFRKGELNEDQLVARLRQHGFKDEEAKRMAKIRLFDPTPADMVQFGVKDVFNADISSRFNVYGENPREGGIGAEEAAGRFDEFLQASGLRPEAWDIQWAAHWNLPAFGQIIEAIHRGFIPERDLDAWLRALDFSPGTREIMRNLFFEQIPRRTVGQLVRFNVLSEEEGINRLEELGFRPRDAALQIEREKFIGGQGPRELTKSDILNAFEDGVIDEATAIKQLQELRFTPEAIAVLISQSKQNIEADQGTVTLPRDREAEEDAVSGIRKAILKSLEDGAVSRGEAFAQLTELGFSSEAANALIDERLLQRELDDRDFVAGELKDMFIERVIDEAQVRGRLQNNGFRSEETDRLLTRWKLERERREKIDAKRDEKPSRTTLEDWLSKGIIGPDTFADRMADIGWQDDDIALFMQEVIIDNQG